MKSFSFATLLSLVAHSFATPVYTPTDAADLVRRDGTGSVTGSAGLSWYDPQIVDGGRGRTNTSSYVCYKGAATNFPARTTWMNFKAMFALQKQVNLQYVDNANQIQYIYNAILNISQLAKVDARVILGVIIEEVCHLLSSVPPIANSRSSHLATSQSRARHHMAASRTAASCNPIIPPKSPLTGPTRPCRLIR